MKNFINSLLLLFVSIIFTFGKGEKFSYSSIPMKDGQPSYERVIAVKNADKVKMQQDIKLFLAAYFHRSTPKIVIDDVSAGRFIATVTIQYKFNGENTDSRGRNTCVLDVHYVDTGYYIKLSEFYVEHTSAEIKWYSANTRELYAAAANGKWWALNEIESIHKQTLQLMDELEKKLKG